MNFLSPRDVLQQVAEALPADVRDSVIIIGSLAAGYRYFRDDPESLVQTKDVDCMLSPSIKAVPAGRAVAESLFKAQWRMREGADWSTPGTAATPVEKSGNRGQTTFSVNATPTPIPRGPRSLIMRLRPGLIANRRRSGESPGLAGVRTTNRNVSTPVHKPPPTQPPQALLAP